MPPPPRACAASLAAACLRQVPARPSHGAAYNLAKGGSMIKNHFWSVFGAVVISAAFAAPMDAAENIEAKVQVCTACHGTNGEPVNATTPIIWGQQEYFIVKQLHRLPLPLRVRGVMWYITSCLCRRIGKRLNNRCSNCLAGRICRSP